MGTAILRWLDRSIEETEQRVYRDGESFDTDNLPPVLATLPPDVQEYRDTTVLEGLDYYYRVSSYREDPELEVFSDIIKINTSYSLGPGPSELVGGTAEMGFFGEVPVGELIDGTSLASAVGLTAGTLQNNNEPWLKFVLDGQILYVARKAFRHSVSWDNINAVGCAYGEKVIEIDGYQYRVRLLKGADEDPSSAASGTDTAGTHNSEWTRLFAPISDVVFPSYTGPKFANYTSSDLGVGPDDVLSGTNSWCQEIEVGRSRRMVRGITSALGITYARWVDSNNTHSARGWRPVLELLV